VKRESEEIPRDICQRGPCSDETRQRDEPAFLVTVQRALGELRL